MHDARRGTRIQRTPEEQAQMDAKISDFKTLYAECFKDRDDFVVSEQVFERQERLLVLNPECYSIWAYRRRVYEALWQQAGTATSAAAAADEGAVAKTTTAAEDDAAFHKARSQALVKELKFNSIIITSDYKCYAAWVHRRWILDHLDAPTKQLVLTGENAKLEQLLRADERNFHAWGYRRWVVSQLQLDYNAYPLTRDLEFTETKISQNISNFSAWHQRVAIANKMVAAVRQGEGDATESALRDLLSKDVDKLVRSFYCDPADQSAWMFSPALLGILKGLAVDRPQWSDQLRSARNKFHDAALELAQDDAADDRALKWPLWMLGTLADGAVELLAPATVTRGGTTTTLTRTSEVWTLLQVVDPMRRGYYLDLLRRRPRE